MTAPELNRAPALTVARAGFGAVVAAAGVSGLALVIWPEATADYFSWGLGPLPLASLIGGLYLASSVTFAVAMRLPWRDAQSLTAASVALTTPTLVFTLVHLDVFDFDRWQAWAWMALFVAAPPFWAGLLIVNRSAVLRTPARLESPAAVATLVLAFLLVVAAVVLWIDPSGAGRVLPFEPSPLGGRFVGAWAAFLAVMAAWVALRPTEAKLPLVALTAYPAGALPRRPPESGRSGTARRAMDVPGGPGTGCRGVRRDAGGQPGSRQEARGRREVRWLVVCISTHRLAGKCTVVVRYILPETWSRYSLRSSGLWSVRGRVAPG